MFGIEHFRKVKAILFCLGKKAT